MIDNLKFRIGNCTQNDAHITIEPQLESEMVEMTGFVRGPFCDWTKTLTADFPLQPVRQTGTQAVSVETLVMEPCYWTPHLPFMYDLQLNLEMADGRSECVTLRTGMKRWHGEGRNFRLEHKRLVLRGLRCTSPDEKLLQLARKCETALLVRNPDATVCELASRLGVPLIADLRDDTQPWQDLCPKFDWYPAVMLVLLSAEQLTEGADDPRLPLHSPVAACISRKSGAEGCSVIQASALAVELSPGERPPAWLAKVDVPVIAISNGPECDIEEARSHCDRLQAALAPHFDLAGYIV